MKERLLMTTVVGTDCWNKLYELFDAMVIVVKVSFVTIVQAYALPATIHDVAETNDDVAIRLLEVISLRSDPALVWKEGVTVKEIELSLVCIQDILFGSP